MVIHDRPSMAAPAMTRTCACRVEFRSWLIFSVGVVFVTVAAQQDRAFVTHTNARHCCTDPWPTGLSGWLNNADSVCDALTRRDAPSIFFTGLSGALPQRWAATPIVLKPAAPKTIIGALRFVLSPEAREILVRSQRGGDDSAKFARLERAISEGDERFMRVRR